jgi:hypothetical protein
MQRPYPRVPRIGEHQLARCASSDHLVIQDVRRHPDQLQVPAALSQQLVPRRKRDQVREALKRNRVAV